MKNFFFVSFFLFSFLIFFSTSTQAQLIAPGDTPEDIARSTDFGESPTKPSRSSSRGGLITANDSVDDVAQSPTFGATPKMALRSIINYILFFLGIISTLALIIGWPLGIYLLISGSRDEQRKRAAQNQQSVQDPDELG